MHGLRKHRHPIHIAVDGNMLALFDWASVHAQTTRHSFFSLFDQTIKPKSNRMAKRKLRCVLVSICVDDAVLEVSGYNPIPPWSIKLNPGEVAPMTRESHTFTWSKDTQSKATIALLGLIWTIHIQSLYQG